MKSLGVVFIFAFLLHPEISDSQKSNFSEPCSTKDQCYANRNLDCVVLFSPCKNQHKCLCENPKQVYVANAKKCLMQSLIGGNCYGDDQCFGKNTVCRNAVCRCINGSVQISSQKDCKFAVDKLIGENCNAEINKCLIIKDGVISGNADCNGTCKCPSFTEFDKKDETCRLSTEGTACEDDSYCSSGLYCKDMTCQCSEGYVYHKLMKMCIMNAEIELGQECNTTDTNSSCVQGTICTKCNRNTQFQCLSLVKHVEKKIKVIHKVKEGSESKSNGKSAANLISDVSLLSIFLLFLH